MSYVCIDLTYEKGEERKKEGDRRFPGISGEISQGHLLLNMISCLLRDYSAVFYKDATERCTVFILFAKL